MRTLKLTINKTQVLYEWKCVQTISGIDNKLKLESDWENCETCDCCGAKIVHVFMVNSKKLGFDCLKNSMRLKSIQSYKDSFLKEYQRNLSHHKNLIQKLNTKKIQIDSYATPEEAVYRYTLKNKLTKKNTLDFFKLGAIVIQTKYGFSVLGDQHFRFPEVEFTLFGTVMPKFEYSERLKTLDEMLLAYKDNIKMRDRIMQQIQALA